MVVRGINPLFLLTGCDLTASKISRKTGLWLHISGGDRFLAAVDRTLSTFCVWFVYSLPFLPPRQSELVTRDGGGGLPGNFGLKCRLSSSGRIASPEIKKDVMHF